MHPPMPHTPWNQPPPGQAHLVLDVKRHWFGFALSMITPSIVLNGHRMLGRWGRNVIPLPPGQYHLHVHLPYLLPAQIGPADLTIWLQPGAALDVEYRAPVFAYSRGALGPAPQPWNGMGCMIALMLVAGGTLAFVVIAVILAIVFG
ncbi:hypothetical protein [Nonomuraea sp. SBT364]|uniref:hypothetical protein n=1 Tax=Nonomuraea sp. SBT364 TaxID=1580530 RepID=UPI0012E0F365|nr:hypothetical protein [Nonomuraea sp. SBT364]